eukprot:60618-Amphidinium_carterae.2
MITSTQESRAHILKRPPKPATLFAHRLIHRTLTFVGNHKDGPSPLASSTVIVVKLQLGDRHH